MFVAVALAVTIAAGLASRRVRGVPEVVQAHGGDALWAAALFFGLALLFLREPTELLAAAALFMAFAVELSQLFSPPWLVELRNNEFLALVLGDTFVRMDLVRYAAGVAVAALFDQLFKRRVSGLTAMQ
jgi:hypothetical protein